MVQGGYNPKKSCEWPTEWHKNELNMTELKMKLTSSIPNKTAKPADFLRLISRCILLQRFKTYIIRNSNSLYYKELAQRAGGINLNRLLKLMHVLTVSLFSCT